MKKFLASLAAIGLITTVYAQDVKSIEQQLVGKNTTEKAQIKSKKIARSVRKGEFSMKQTSIEIVGIQEITGGVEVFAKAWKNGKQLGFGKDGSVEIERFRFYNPPIMVDDPSGKVVREIVNPFTGAKTYRTLREDPEQAMKESLVYVVGLVEKDGNIVKGKIGNTTSTFYSAAGINEPVDGYVYYGNFDFATARDALAGTVADNSGANLIVGTSVSSSVYNILRSFLLFDTSPIGTDTISSAVLSSYVTTINNLDNDANAWINVFATNPASTSVLITADYDLIGTTKGATDINLSAMSTSAFSDSTLNATGRGWIDPAGITKLGYREGHDVNNSAPDVGANAEQDVYFASADTAGTTSDPKLVIEHTVSASTGAPAQVIFW